MLGTMSTAQIKRSYSWLQDYNTYWTVEGEKENGEGITVKMEKHEAHLTERKCPNLHEEYHTRHEIPAISDGVRQTGGGISSVTEV